jgi:hypothetical protein
MREKLRKVMVVAVGITAMTGGLAAVADAAKHAKHHAKKAHAKAQTKKAGPTAARGAELAGDTKTSAEAAALAAVPGGTVQRSHAARAGNPDGAAYVVRVEKADDTYVDVLEDASFTVLKVVDARPCHGGAGGGDRPHPEPLAGDTKTSAEAAALAAVPGGTVQRSVAAPAGNPDGAAYAVIVEKADDTYVKVLEDASFSILKVVADDHQGGPRGPRGGHPGSEES